MIELSVAKLVLVLSGIFLTGTILGFSLYQSFDTDRRLTQNAEVEFFRQKLKDAGKEIERLKAPTTDWLVKGFTKEELERIKIEALKAEAIKEFAERLKRCFDRFQIAMYSEGTVVETINNLVKEMVGDE